MKVISVPLSSEAEKRLDINESFDGDLIEIELSEKEFNDLYEIGIFNKLNKDLSLMIDDYEDEFIETKNLDLAKEIVIEHLCYRDCIIQLLKILGLLSIAKAKKTSIHFYF